MPWDTYAWIGVISAVLGALSAIAGIAVNALLSKRRESGSADTADASTLFNASHQLIQSLMTSQQHLSQRLDAMTGQFDKLLQRVEQLINQQSEMIRQAREQTKTLHSIEESASKEGVKKP